MNLYLDVTICDLEEDSDFYKVAEQARIALQEAFKYSDVLVDVVNADVVHAE